jgi:endonuclease/exonuclease/phosphatase family metal-dependent hydrolase
LAGPHLHASADLWSASLLHRATGKTVHVINTHFDYGGSLAREESAKLVRRYIQTLYKDRLRTDSFPAILLMADLNDEEGSITHSILTGRARLNGEVDLPDSVVLVDTRRAFRTSSRTPVDPLHNRTPKYKYALAPRTGHPWGFDESFTGFQDHEPGRLIDHIMFAVKRDTPAANIAVMNHILFAARLQDGHFVSDHRPVVADIQVML